MSYSFADRQRRKLQDSEFPSLGTGYQRVINIDYSTVCKDGDGSVICETIVQKEVIELPMPPKRLCFPFKETYDWSAVPRHF